MTAHWQAKGVVAALGAALAARRRATDATLEVALGESDRSDLPHMIFARDLETLTELDSEASEMIAAASQSHSQIAIVRGDERITVDVPAYRIITSAALAGIVETLAAPYSTSPTNQPDMVLASHSPAGETCFESSSPIDTLTFVYQRHGESWTEAMAFPVGKSGLIIAGTSSDGLDQASDAIIIDPGNSAPVVDEPRITTIDRALAVARALPEGRAAIESAIARLEKAAQHPEANVREWIAGVGRYAQFDIDQFAYSLLTRSQRIGHAQISPELSRRIQQRLSGDETVPPMFAPLRLRNLTLANRVAVSPMCTYSAKDGEVDDFHLVHLGARAQGGAGLIFTEMTAVAPDGRITPNCAGIYSDALAEKWARIVDFVHRSSSAKIAMQLGHAGRKGATRPPWEGADLPAPDGWPLVAPSALPWSKGSAVPSALTPEQMAEITDQFAEAARRASDAGFDMIELHFAHGYLLSSFISPLTNLRTDDYGGGIENRMRFPLEVLTAARVAWGEERPISVRISACDWTEGGLSTDDLLTAAALLRDGGADLISVSTGQTTPNAKPRYGQMYQVPFSDRIRNEVGIPTLAVGAITEPDQVNAIIGAGRADLCALARKHLVDPYWTLHAAAAQNVESANWPNSYLSGAAMLKRRRAA